MVQRSLYQTDGGITIDMSKLKAVTVDSRAKTVTVQGEGSMLVLSQLLGKAGGIQQG